MEQQKIDTMTFLKKIIAIFFLITQIQLGLMAQHQLTIEKDTYFKVNDQINIHLQDCQLTNNGNLHLSNGIVSILGNGADTLSLIDGDSICSFFHLRIDKSQNHVALGQNIEIQDSLFLLSGQIVLNDYNVLFHQGADFYQAVDTSYIQTNGLGQLRQVIGRSIKTYPIGLKAYNPITLENLASSDTFSVRLSNHVLADGTSGDTIQEATLDITWLVEKATGDGSDSRLNITTQWNEHQELTNFNREKVYLAHFKNGNWDDFTTAAATGSNPYAISRNNVIGLSPFTVFSELCPPEPIPLPVSAVIKRGKK